MADTKQALPYEANYRFVEDHVKAGHMKNAMKALPLVGYFLIEEHGDDYGYLKERDRRAGYYNHALAIARSLIDLKVPFSNEETDLAVAAALCHVLKELIAFPKEGRELHEVYGLDPQVYDIICLITRKDPLTEEQQKLFYQRIQENKMAILVRFADRGNLVQMLTGTDLWETQEYVRETRQYFFPMCIYAKERYPEMIPVVSILMEKMRYMIEVVDVLATRHQEREKYLTNEILAMKEDNARLRSMISLMQGPQDVMW